MFNGLFGLQAYILANEYVGKTWIGTTGVLANMWFSVGEIVLGAVAFAVPRWRSMTLVGALAWIPLLAGAVAGVPESARWLLATGDVEGAMMCLREVAKVNQVKFPANGVLRSPNVLPSNDSLARSNDSSNTNANNNNNNISTHTTNTDNSRVDNPANTTALPCSSSRKGGKGDLWLLWSNRELRKRQIALSVAWGTCSLLFYGLTSAGAVRVFRQEFTLEDDIGSHACSLEALACV
jgi:hypothetical protein